MSDDAVEYKDMGLDNLLKALSAQHGKLPVARVGVLGGNNSRSKGKATSNAAVGAAHEFGTSKLPMRSFLRVPVTDQLQNFLDKAEFFTPDVTKQVLHEGSIAAWVAKVGIVAETVVKEAFNTGGFGKWKPSNMSRKKTKQTLVETQQLVRSISSDVK